MILTILMKKYGINRYGLLGFLVMILLGGITGFAIGLVVQIVYKDVILFFKK